MVVRKKSGTFWKMVELMLNMIKPAEYLSTVANVAYVDYSEISKRIKPIIAEAQIVMRR